MLAAPESDAARAADAQPNILGASAEEKVQKQQQAMMTIAADSMRVTAANKDAWIEICTCPLSLVSIAGRQSCMPLPPPSSRSLIMYRAAGLGLFEPSQASQDLLISATLLVLPACCTAAIGRLCAYHLSCGHLLLFKVPQ